MPRLIFRDVIAMVGVLACCSCSARPGEPLISATERTAVTPSPPTSVVGASPSAVADATAALHATAAEVCPPPGDAGAPSLLSPFALASWSAPERPLVDQVTDIQRIEATMTTSPTAALHLQLADAYCELERTSYRQCVDVGSRDPVSVDAAMRDIAIVKRRAKNAAAAQRASLRHCGAVAAAAPSPLSAQPCPTP